MTCANRDGVSTGMKRPPILCSSSLSMISGFAAGFPLETCEKLLTRSRDPIWKDVSDGPQDQASPECMGARRRGLGRLAAAAAEAAQAGPGPRAQARPQAREADRQSPPAREVARR